MRLNHGIIAATLLAVGAPMPMRAQEPRVVSVDSGTVVQAHLTNGMVVTGRLLSRLASTTTSLDLCPYPGPTCWNDTARVRHLPRTAVASLLVQHGTQAAKAAFIGGLIGALVGGLMDGLYSETHRSGLSQIMIGPGGGILLGALLGASEPVWKEQEER